MVMDIPLEIAELSGARDKLNLDLVSVREAIAEAKGQLGSILKSGNEGAGEPGALKKKARKALDRLLQREGNLRRSQLTKNYRTGHVLYGTCN